MCLTLKQQRILSDKPKNLELFHECEICRANESDTIRARAELLESPSPYLDLQ